ncbi:hypothetical protein BH10CYA1_BH10CYA1_39660 [soil metagenome]
MSNDYEIIPKAATPPKEWLDIDPYLSKGQDKSSSFSLVTAVTIVIFSLVLAAMTFFMSGWLLSLVIVIVTVVVVASIFGLRTATDDYGRYATWIHETIQPSDAKLELTVKWIGEHGGKHYQAKVIDSEGKEEIYDIKSISPDEGYGASLSEGVKDAKVYRDPNNQQCVVAAVGPIMVWLWEYTPY